MCTFDTDSLECDSAGCLQSAAGLGQLRQGVRAFLSPVPAEQLVDAVLVVDELVTHALRHGESPVRLRLQQRDHHRVLWIEVYDATTIPPQAYAPSAQHGLRLLDTVCTTWGVIPASPGTTVWAELALAP